ncbi:MAG: prolyl oligopeptidase family serine peptidase [Planctomycetota bacterium]|jgi:predicted esterase
MMFRLLLAALVVLAGTAWGQEYGRTLRLKLAVGGGTRKAGLFLPKGIRKNEELPLLVAIPAAEGKAFLELGQWQQPAFEKRLAVFSVDVKTSSGKGWLPTEQIAMQRDMEAVTEGIKTAVEEAKKQNVVIDTSAMAITGHSGGTYLTLWLGIRRPDLFFAVCGRGVVFFKETVKLGKGAAIEPNFDQRILLYRGELDHPRVAKETEAASKLLKETGWKNVRYRVVARMVHESKPEIFLEWYETLLLETAKGRKESRKIAKDLEKIRPAIEKGKSGSYSKLLKLAEREQKSGFSAGAQALLAQEVEKAKKHFARAEHLEADGEVYEAIKVFKEVEKKYSPLPISKQARERAGKVLRSDAYKASELLKRAKHFQKKGDDVKAAEILEKIVEKYPNTPAADEARHLLQ